LRLRRHRNRAIKVANSERTPNGTPTSTPTFVASLEDGGIDADAEADADVVVVDVLVVVVEDVVGEGEGHGVATSPIIAAIVDNALGPGIVKLPQPGVSPQIHDPTAQPQDHESPPQDLKSPTQVSEAE
jgi:hypothetical protein